MDLLEIDDEDEIINDDGFVYKHKKRRLDPTTVASSSAPPPPDPSIEDKKTRLRKKKALINLKRKYQKELSQWELLSNTLKAMELKSQTLKQARQEHAPLPSSDGSSSAFAPNGLCGQILDQLLVQPKIQELVEHVPKGHIPRLMTIHIRGELTRKVEAQEDIIQDVSNVCDMAEALCNAEEERLKQNLIELPVWDYSPQELMASLCEE